MRLKEILDQLQGQNRITRAQQEKQLRHEHQVEREELNNRIALNMDEFHRQQSIISQYITDTHFMEIINEAKSLVKGKLEDNTWSYIDFESRKPIDAHKFLFLKWSGRHADDYWKSLGIKIEIRRDRINIDAAEDIIVPTPDLFDRSKLEYAIASAINSPGDYTHRSREEWDKR